MEINYKPMKKTFFIPLIFFCLTLFFHAYCYSQAGILDPTFGEDGIVITPLGSNYDNINSIALQPDGKIVAGGFYAGATDDFALTRYHEDGSLDDTFGDGGIVFTDFYESIERITAIGIQDDGKIVAAGYTYFVGKYYFALARYNADGSLDLTFDEDGKAMADVGTYGSVGVGMVLQPDGKIIVIGVATDEISLENAFGVVRFNTDGSLDNSFGLDGMVTTTNTGQDIAFAVTLQPDGKIIIAGSSSTLTTSDFTLMRLNPDGTLDAGFGIEGIVSTDITEIEGFRAVAVDADGNIIAAGTTGTIPDNDFALVRYHSNGTIDNTFGDEGIVINEIDLKSSVITSVSLQTDGKIIAGGQLGEYPDNGFILARYDANGNLDNAFGIGGIVKTTIGMSSSISDIVLQSDGKIITAGYSDDGSGYTDFTLARYTTETETAVQYSTSDFKINLYPNPAHDVLMVDLSAEYSGKPLAIYNAEGMLMKTVVLDAASTAISLDGFAGGLYSICMIDEAGHAQRFIVQ